MRCLGRRDWVLRVSHDCLAGLWCGAAGEEASSKITQVGRIPFLESVALTPLSSRRLSARGHSQTLGGSIAVAPSSAAVRSSLPSNFSLSLNLLDILALTRTDPPRQSPYIRVDWLVNLITSAKSLCCITQPNPEIPRVLEATLDSYCPNAAGVSASLLPHPHLQLSSCGFWCLCCGASSGTGEKTVKKS